MKFLLIALLSFSGFQALAQQRTLDSIMAKATPAERKDLVKLLKQISMVPEKDPKTGKMVFKVTRVEKGSVYEREGVKVGDLLQP